MKKRAGERKQNPAGLKVVDADFKPESEAYEEPDLEEDAWEEEEEAPLSPWVTVLIFVGLAVLAALICVILWHFSHRDSDEDARGTQAGIEASQGEDPQEEESPGEESSGTASGESAENLGGESKAAGEEGNGAGDEKEGPEMQEGGNLGDQSEVSPDQPQEAEEGQIGVDAAAETDGGQENLQEPVQGTAAMSFTEADESVTPKDVVNLRSVPTTTDEDNIVVQVQNGEILTRSGLNQDTGWSRIEYGGQTLYAVTQYLTTNLDYKPPVQQSNPNRVSTISGRIILFSDCDDWISPKEYVNLRTEPSTTEGDATVSCQLNNGEKAHRTGYSPDSGWSRVEYDGKVLYVVTSLMYTVEGD